MCGISPIIITILWLILSLPLARWLLCVCSSCRSHFHQLHRLMHFEWWQTTTHPLTAPPNPAKLEWIEAPVTTDDEGIVLGPIIKVSYATEINCLRPCERQIHLMRCNYTKQPPSPPTSLHFTPSLSDLIHYAGICTAISGVTFDRELAVVVALTFCQRESGWTWVVERLNYSQL